jgi:hypothetical protein
LYDCVFPYACGWMFDCDVEEFAVSFSQLSEMCTEEEMEEEMDDCDMCDDVIAACDEACEALMNEDNFNNCVCELMATADDSWFEGADDCE